MENARPAKVETEKSKSDCEDGEHYSFREVNSLLIQNARALEMDLDHSGTESTILQRNVAQV